MRRLTPLKAAGVALGAALTVMLLAPGPAQATEVGSARPFGLGFAIGSPTSIVGKYFIGGNNAIDFGLGFWSYGRRRYCRDYRDRDWDDCGYRGFSINGDYL